MSRSGSLLRAEPHGGPGGSEAEGARASDLQGRPNDSAPRPQKRPANRQLFDSSNQDSKQTGLVSGA